MVAYLSASILAPLIPSQPLFYIRNHRQESIVILPSDLACSQEVIVVGECENPKRWAAVDDHQPPLGILLAYWIFMAELLEGWAIWVGGHGVIVGRLTVRVNGVATVHPLKLQLMRGLVPIGGGW